MITKKDVQLLLNDYENSFDRKLKLVAEQKFVGALKRYLQALKIDNDVMLDEVQSYELVQLLSGWGQRAYRLRNPSEQIQVLVKRLQEKLEFGQSILFSQSYDPSVKALASFFMFAKANNQPALGVLNSPSVRHALSSASRGFYHLFFEGKTIDNSLLRKLLNHAALGELDALEILWRKAPHLLARRGTIYHPNRIYDDHGVGLDIPLEFNPGRYLYPDRTAVQILWMNEEYAAAKLMEDFIDPSVLRELFWEVFPDGKIQKYNFDLEKAKALLETLFDEIAKGDGQMNQSTQAALLEFQHYIKPDARHSVGLVFDVQVYDVAIKLYFEKSDACFKSNPDKHRFWRVAVEEWLVGCFGTGYLRLHAQGFTHNELGRVYHKKGCILADGSSYFAFRRTSDSIPGRHYSVNAFGLPSLAADIKRGPRGDIPFMFNRMAYMPWLSKRMSENDNAAERLMTMFGVDNEKAIGQQLR